MRGVLIFACLGLALLAGCSVLEGGSAPYEGPTTNTTITRELVLTQGRNSAGNAVTSINCLTIPDSFWIVRGSMNANWTPISATTSKLMLEIDEGGARSIASTEDLPPPLHVDFEDLKDRERHDRFYFMVLLGHDGSVRDQKVNVTLELEVAGDVAPEASPAKCTG